MEPRPSPDTIPPLCGDAPADSTLGPAHCPATPPSPTHCACPTSTEPAPAPELITADPIPPDDDAPAPHHSSPMPTPTTLPSPPPSASPSPVRPSSAPPSPPPSPPSPRRLCAIQSCNRPAYVDKRPDALAICCSRRHQLLHTALQQTPVCAIAECTRPVHIDEQAAIVHEYCGITHARLAATRGESWFSQDRPAAVAGAEVCAYTGCDREPVQSSLFCGRAHAYAHIALTPPAQPAAVPPDAPPAPLRCALPSCNHATVSFTPTIARVKRLPTAAPSISSFISLCSGSDPRVPHRTRRSQRRRLPPAGQPLRQLFSYAPYRRAKTLLSSTLALATWRSAAATATNSCTPPFWIHRSAALPTAPCQCSSSLTRAPSTVHDMGWPVCRPASLLEWC